MPIYRARAAALTPHLHVGAGQGIISVSYTHLDVYKRQVWVFSMLLGASVGKVADIIAAAQNGLFFRIRQFFASIGALDEWQWALIWRCV